MAIVDQLVQALQDESDSLDGLVATLPDEKWATMTPSEGWSIAHQIGHLLWTDRVSLLSITDEAAFAELVASAMTDPMGFVDAAAETEAARPPAELLTDWRKTRARLAGALLAVEEGRKLNWFGPPMSAASMATARLMESWAHGLDVAEALGVPHPEGDRIKHVVHLGVRTRNFAYLVNGLDAPADDFRYEITAPSGELWTWGPDTATNVVRGPAVDFCELVTQRRHLSDLALEVIGDDAAQWASIAQVFAGPPGGGRPAQS
ncbi:TIGR03084 family metal-binding protein [Gordonia sp. (in: high G+C Gram-positive bacteria)]|uniref:TIGR03084 family metal-binding protein n=1 Tax=Gordonia sp. (in: high G+C Gram-positive bacteria) TaxID=84139 RepID=UPI0016B1635C|nr:TIGR03084 family metal-binding protein [Gordonia sp. (in: high G+C Gram-positive bacteria)]NLG46097.1 TIGR03084 family protein [Gordonia sp. (in: high G+C Gram-positive bacteria)]